MKNFYEKKFTHYINNLKYTKDEALVQVVQVYLDNKPQEINKIFISQEERDDWFWHSFFLVENQSNFIKLDLYSLALTKNFRSRSLYDIDMIKESSNTNPFAVKHAIKYSKIFLDQNNKNYVQLKNVLLEDKVFTEFFQISESVAKHYNDLKKDVQNKENILMSYGYVDLLFLMSLSTLKYTQIHAMYPGYFTTYSMTLTSMIEDRLTKKDRRKKAIDQTHIEEKVKKYFMHNVHKSEAPEEFKLFEEVFKAYEAVAFFEQNTLYTFLYDENYQSSLAHDKVILSPIDMKKHIKSEMHSEKLQSMFNYYENIVKIDLEDTFQSDYKKAEENRAMNFFQTLRVHQTQLIMSEIYGLDKDVFIDDAKTLDVGHLIYTGYALSSLYAFDFLGVYLPILQKYEKENWWQAYREIITHSMKTHKKNRLPLIYKTINEFVLEIKRNQQIDFGEKIIDFWSHDLKAGKTNNIKYPTLFEKPFIKIDDYEFVFPWLMSFSGTSPMTFINSLLRVHTNRMELLETGKKHNVRKEEVSRSEKNLAEFFKRLGFEVEDGYTHSKEAEKYGVQDMDIVASKDSHLFILELKSTYIRETLESNWIYKTGRIRKAGHQLKKRRRYIEKLLEEDNKKFIDKFGRPEHIHTWIVDTSFESDHLYVDDSLKISMFELINALTTDSQSFYPNGFNVDKFIENVKSEKLWENLVMPEITREEATYTISP